MSDTGPADPGPAVRRRRDRHLRQFADRRAAVAEPSPGWSRSRCCSPRCEELADALPEPRGSESRRDAIERALTTGPFATPDTELTLAYILGVLLIGAPGWQLLTECVATPRAVLFVSPSARLARVPWGLLAVPKSGPSKEELVRARQDAITASGRAAAQIPWQLADIGEHTDGHRLMELVDVLMAVPPNIVHSPRTPAGWDARRDGPPVLVLDPRVPGQRPDSALGSVLGRPSPETPLARHFAELMERRPVLPDVDAAVELFRRQDADRAWLAKLLAQAPSRLLYVGHASSGARPGRPGGAAPGLYGGDSRRRRRNRRPSPADRVGPDVIAVADAAAGGPAGVRIGRGLSIRRGDRSGGGDDPGRRTAGDAPPCGRCPPPRPIDSLRPATADAPADPMADVVVAVDDAHEGADAGCAVNRWQREQMRRWRDGVVTASPLYWGAVVTFAVDGAR